MEAGTWVAVEDTRGEALYSATRFGTAPASRTAEVAAVAAAAFEMGGSDIPS